VVPNEKDIKNDKRLNTKGIPKNEKKTIGNNKK